MSPFHHIILPDFHLTYVLISISCTSQPESGLFNDMNITNTVSTRAYCYLQMSTWDAIELNNPSDWRLWAFQLPSESWKFRMRSADFFKSWLPKEWLLILHVFAILTPLSKWSVMEILPDHAGLVQATYFQLILHPFIRMIGFKNWFYV